MTDKFYAATIYLEQNDKVLGVARRGTNDQWGLPGGKIEENELPEKAAIRELFEETGLIVEIDSLKILHTGVDDVDNNVITFISHDWSGDLIQGDAGPVKFISKEELVSGPYKEYNLACILKALKC